ncbi:uncharacterized protein LOC123262282 [Cotesia glomerata]|uniref:uncharacterized protein LOC123262282 n=1 Tax=Cotesia glomerata TaxID=32391 RepID=UPI001D022750|nr:uncharacterized protein LOC123262282 [Cotesia glomerata]
MSFHQTCHLCKQNTVKNAFIRSGCNNVFHKSCRGKKHRCLNIMNDLVQCVGHDLNKFMDTKSTKSSDSLRQTKRKRTEEADNDFDDKMDLLLDRFDSMKADNDLLKSEIKLLVKSEIKQSVKKELEDFKKEIAVIVTNSVRKELMKMNRSTVNVTTPSVTYSSRLHSYIGKVQQSQLENIIVEPKEKQDTAVTVQKLKKSVDVGKFGLGIDRIGKTRSGKVIIGCKQKQDSCKLVEELKKSIGQDYNIKMKDKKMPKIKIIDIEEDIISEKTDEEIIKMIQRQNDIPLDENSKMDIKKKGIGKKRDGLIIMEVDPKLHKYLVEINRIKLGWNKCRVLDCVSVLRCYKCWGYYHFAKDCRNGIKCRRCAGDHKEEECDSTEKKCVNCQKMKDVYKVDDIEVNHWANDVNCEYYRRTRNKAQKNIKYFSE